MHFVVIGMSMLHGMMLNGCVWDNVCIAHGLSAIFFGDTRFLWLYWLILQGIGMRHGGIMIEKAKSMGFLRMKQA